MIEKCAKLRLLRDYTTGCMIFKKMVNDAGCKPARYEMACVVNPVSEIVFVERVYIVSKAKFFVGFQDSGITLG